MRDHLSHDADAIVSKKTMRRSVFIGVGIQCAVFSLIAFCFGSCFIWFAYHGQNFLYNFLYCTVGIACLFLLLYLWYGKKQIAKLDVIPPFEKLDQVGSKYRRWKKFYKKYNKTDEICPIQIEGRIISLDKPVLSWWRRTYLRIAKVLLFFRRYFLHYWEIIISLPDYQDMIFQYQSMHFVLSHHKYPADVHHNAIIICPSRGFKPEYFTNGPELLVEYFSTHQIPYKVYLPQNREEFLQIIQNEKTAVLWLFGHGTIGSFGITLKESMKYVDLIGTPLMRCRKIAIHQLHCNGKNWESPYSLSRLLVDGWDFHEKGLQDPGKNRAYVKYVLNHQERFPGIWEGDEKSY